MIHTYFRLACGFRDLRRSIQQLHDSLREGHFRTRSVGLSGPIDAVAL
jgi:hypothetical protein